MKRRWTKRHPPHLAPEQIDSFLALQAEWDGRLKAAGFKDVESGYDLAEHDVTTFRGGDARNGVTFVPLTDIDLDQADLSPTAANPTAEYWRMFARAANQLPRRYPRRAFILAVADVGHVRSALLSRHRVSRMQARYAIAQFCARAKIPEPQFQAPKTEIETTAPARALGSAEKKFVALQIGTRTMSAEALERLRAGRRGAA